MDAAVKTFEGHFILRKRHPEWFDVSMPSMDLLKTLISSGFFYLLKNRDASGRRVLMVNADKFDVDKYNSNEAFVGSYISVLAALESEETQVIGFVHVINYTNTTMSYFSKFPVGDVVDWVKSMEALPGRYKKFIVIGLPSFAVTLLNMVKLAMNEKQRDRLILLNSEDELCNHFDRAILPERFGGSESEAEIIKSFIQLLEDNKGNLEASNDFEIDEIRANLNSTKEVVGSFRKLEID